MKATSPKDLIIIGYDTKGDNTHVLFDERGCEDPTPAMVENVSRFGVVEPVVVTKAMQVIDGRRRVRAARKARLESIPYLVVDEDQAEDLLISLNEIRKPTSALARAERMKNYCSRVAEKLATESTGDMPEIGTTEWVNMVDKFMPKAKEQAAIMFGISTKQVGNYLALLDCCAAVRRAVERGDLSPTAASKLAGLEKEAQEKTLVKLLKQSGGKRIRVEEVSTGKRKGKRPSGVLLRRMVKAWYKGKDPEDQKVLSKVKATDDFWWGVDFAMGGLKVDEVGGLAEAMEHFKS